MGALLQYVTVWSAAISIRSDDLNSYDIHERVVLDGVAGDHCNGCAACHAVLPRRAQ